MRTAGLGWVWVLSILWCAGAVAAPKTSARLAVSHAEARPGDEVYLGIVLTMAPGWHTYWRYSGDSGAPTKVAWTLPRGVTAGPIEWPVPRKLSADGLTTYVLEGEEVLLVRLSIGSEASRGPIDLAGSVDWLECEEACVPGSAKVSARLQIGDASKPSESSAVFERAKARLPKPSTGLDSMGGWEKPPTNGGRPLIVEWTLGGPSSDIDFFPYAAEDYEVASATEVLSREGGKARLRKVVTLSGQTWPKAIEGVLVETPVDGGKSRGFEVRLALLEEGAGTASTSASGGGAGAGRPGAAFKAPEAPLLAQMLFFGLLGGMILNIMPCVFPVIALKILGFVNQGREAPGRVFRLGLTYAAGVYLSFLVLAAMVLVVRAAGGAASWGMQMQNPQFTLVLTTLVVIVALNLFGLFEVNLGGAAMGAAGSLSSKEGGGGAFFNGVLATVLATPCTAPFLAPALGFAFAQPAWVVVAMFVAVATGLSLPYVVLSWHPGWLKVLPRPGAWMEAFKVAMGFPMLATAVWLFSFTAPRFGEDGALWLGLCLVLVAMAFWVWGEFVQRARTRRWPGTVAALVLAVGVGYVLEGELHWRSPSGTVAGPQPVKQGGIPWQRWSPAAVNGARAEGRPVLVDFTASWCLTCKANKRTSIEVEPVRAKLREIDAVTLVGDYTEQDPMIAAELQRFDRAGVPLVLVYPKDRSKGPEILPALLTQTIVLEALDRAVR